MRINLFMGNVKNFPLARHSEFILFRFFFFRFHVRATATRRQFQERIMCARGERKIENYARQWYLRKIEILFTDVRFAK